MRLWVSNPFKYPDTMRRLGLRDAVRSSVGSGFKEGDTFGDLYDNLMVTWSTRVVEYSEFGTKLHAVWHYADGIDRLAELASSDSVVLKLGIKLSLNKTLWDPDQERVVICVLPFQKELALKVIEGIRLVASHGGCQFVYMAEPKTPSQIDLMMCGVFDGGVFKSHDDYIFLPNGKMFTKVETKRGWTRKELENFREWIRLVGFSIDEITKTGPLGTKTRRHFNLASTFWASKNWNAGVHPVRPEKAPEWAEEVARMGAAPELLPGKRRYALAMRGQEKPNLLVGDLVACDYCSLTSRCRLYRSSSICVLPESDMGELAEQFNTRDVNTIIGGLGNLLAKEADRAERFLKAEEQSEVDTGNLERAVDTGLSNEVTKIIHGLFDRGNKLAKLLDPRLAGGAKVAINVGAQNAQIVAGATPQQLVAATVAELQAEGYTMDQITPELIKAKLGIANDAPAAIEATATAIPEVVRR